MNTIRKQAGFTLIELMIVIAIIAILLAIAVPAYQDYTIRAQNSECINVAASAKLFVAETVQSQGVTVDSGSANLSGWTGPSATDYCTSVTIADTGVITASSSAGPTGTFTFTPEQAAATDAIDWTCDYTGFEANQVPAECRGS